MKEYKPKLTTLVKYKVFFKTTDGKAHESLKYHYIDKIMESKPREYLMRKILKDGYILDNLEIMYPISNVVSVQFQLYNTIDNAIQDYHNGDYYLEPLIEIFKDGKIINYSSLMYNGKNV